MLAALNGKKITRRLKLHDYQIDGVNKTEAAWLEFDRALGAAATGSGKSALAGEIIARGVEAGKRCLMLAHQRKLCQQFAHVTERDYGIWSTLEMGGSKSEDSPLVCATVQTMVNRIRKGHINPKEFHIVVWDEGHHCSSKTHEEIAEAFPHAKHLGITATPVASGQRDLMKWFDVKVFDIKLTWLIENGYLCRLENLNIPIDIKVDESEVRTGDFKEEMLGSAIDPHLNKCADWLATAPEAQGRACLIFQPLIRTSKRFVELLKERGIKADHIDGTMGDVERERILRAFAMGDITHLSNSMLLTEGIDLPWVSLILNLRLTRSWVLFCQIIGRGTRLFSPEKNGLKGTKWGPKESCLIVDPLWQCDEINPMRLPNLISEDEAEAAEIDAVMKRQLAKGGKADLMSAAADVKSQREEALRRRLEAMSKRKSRLVDACEFFLNINCPSLYQHESMARWEKEPMTTGQKTFLESIGFDIESVRDRGMASVIIEQITRRRKEGYATVKMAKFGSSLGMIDAFERSYEDVKRFLDEHQSGLDPYRGIPD